ncbi:hypothetical protein V6x_02400 [Gimesia chilikensis]|uniref:Uncharacterized protein n=1 Tax=Gimesia chilikensis TaxID=2605989 RepID=A0A517W5N9_9PLAN|nr:hypothetical protein V6x_02400 [Gimesia chilikensis]
MIISLSPLRSITDSLTSVLLMSFAYTLSRSVDLVLSAQTNFSGCSDQVICRTRSIAQWSALISIPF